MSTQKVAGRTVIVGDEVYVITCDKALPRHYAVAATFLAAMILPQLRRGDIAPLLYAGFIGLATLALSWLFDDRDRYRLSHIIDLTSAREIPAKAEGQPHD